MAAEYVEERRVQGRAEKKEEVCVTRSSSGCGLARTLQERRSAEREGCELLAAFDEFSDFFGWQGSECFSKRLDLVVRRVGKTFANAAKKVAHAQHRAESFMRLP